MVKFLLLHTLALKSSWQLTFIIVNTHYMG